MKPFLYFILDGASERVGLDDSTALLQAGSILDNNGGSGGWGGLVQVIAPGIAPESHSGLLNLMGYSLRPEEVPRGPVEAVGLGMAVSHGDLVFRMNFGTLDPDTGLVVDRRVCRSLLSSEAEQLCRDIEIHCAKEIPDLSVRVRGIRNYRACASISPASGTEFSDAISNTDPGYPTDDQEMFSDSGFAKIPCRPLVNTAAACAAAAAVNRFVECAENALASHSINRDRQANGEPSANVILTRGPGCRIPAVTPLPAKLGLQRVTMVAESTIEFGVAKIMGCQVESYESSSDRLYTYRRIQAIVARLVESGEACLVHIKGPDEYGHDGDSDGKRRCVEDIYTGLIAPLLATALRSHIVVLSCDHATPCSLRRHSDDKVPFVVLGVAPPNVSQFDETSCAASGIIMSGSQSFDALVNLLGGDN